MDAVVHSDVIVDVCADVIADVSADVVCGRSLGGATYAVVVVTAAAVDVDAASDVVRTAVVGTNENRNSAIAPVKSFSRTFCRQQYCPW